MSARPTPEAMRHIRESRFRLISPSPTRLAAHLIAHFRIPHGDGLVIALGCGSFCNHSTLRHWVRLELTRIAEAPVDNLLVALEERLLKRLQQAFPDHGGEVEVPSGTALASDLPLPYWMPTEKCDADGRAEGSWRSQIGSLPPYLNTKSLYPDKEKRREDS